MSSNTRSAPEDPDGLVAQFLHDIEVELGLRFADPQRLPMRLLMPYYARHAGLGPAERIVAAWRDLRDPQASAMVRGVVSGALQRCANLPLGIDRSLVVLDAALVICPEVLGDNLWHHLWLRQEAARQPRWIRDLVLRLTRMKIRCRLPQEDLLRGIELVHPSGFEPLLRWICSYGVDGPGATGLAIDLLNKARERLLAREIDGCEVAVCSDEWDTLVELGSDSFEELARLCDAEDAPGPVRP